MILIIQSRFYSVAECRDEYDILYAVDTMARRMSFINSSVYDTAGRVVATLDSNTENHTIRIPMNDDQIYHVVGKDGTFLFKFRFNYGVRRLFTVDL